MRNEAKSIEIAGKVADGYGIDFEPLAEAALDMAEWKDKEFKEYLENKVKSYKSRGENFFTTEIKTIEEIINELFKED